MASPSRNGPPRPGPQQTDRLSNATYFDVPKPDCFDVNFWDAKFWPFAKPGEDPIFAAVGKQTVYVFQLVPTLESKGKDARNKANEPEDATGDDDDDDDDADADADADAEADGDDDDQPGPSTSDPATVDPGSKRHIKQICQFVDDDPDVYLTNICWTYHPRSGHPLLCVAGGRSKTNEQGRKEFAKGTTDIKVLDVKKKRHVATLSGHGLDVSQLVASPTDPEIIVSAGNDHTAKVWHLNKKYRAQPCVALFAGPQALGHKLGVLSLAFHKSGQWLLTGGYDAAVKLWKMPDVPNEDSGTDHREKVQWPHFHTQALHYDKVDCVAFYKDFVVTKSPARRNAIAVWAIDGFEPATMDVDGLVVPPETCGAWTRSSFGKGWQQLLALSLPNSDAYWLRFGISLSPPLAPLLAICRLNGSVSVWDLDRLEEEAKWKLRQHADSDGGDRDLLRTGTQNGRVTEQGPCIPSEPHQTFRLTAFKGMNFFAYVAAWSPDGRWCVFPGHTGRLVVCFRSVSE